MSDNTVILEPTYNNVEITKNDNQVIISSSGPQGPVGNTGQQGPAGPQGIPGDSVASSSFVYEQQSSSSVWSITHNLGYRPSVFTTDYAHNTLEGDIVHTSVNQVIITFTDSVVGYAYLT